jgi:hypothetical protein
MTRALQVHHSMHCYPFAAMENAHRLMSYWDFEAMDCATGLDESCFAASEQHWYEQY